MRKKIETYVVSDIATSCTSERLDGVCFSLFHLCLITTLDDGNALPIRAAVDLVAADSMAVQVTDRLHGISSSVDLDLVTLHSLLNCCTDIAHADINTRFLNRS